MARLGAGHCLVLAGAEEDGDPELVANLTLASLVLQLGSLARQAEDMFGELEAEVRAVEDTSRRIRQRVSGLRVTVASLDCLEEEVASLESCWVQEARSRDRGEDTGLLTPATRPRHLAHLLASLATGAGAGQRPGADPAPPYVCIPLQPELAGRYFNVETETKRVRRGSGVGANAACYKTSQLSQTVLHCRF